MNHPESSSKDVHCQLLGGQGSASPDPLNFPYNFKVIPEPPNLRLNSQSYQESLRGLLKANYFSRNVLESCPLLPMHGWLTGRSCYGVLAISASPHPDSGSLPYHPAHSYDPGFSWLMAFSLGADWARRRAGGQAWEHRL